MRTALIFPPGASPTYTPLGIATLHAFLRSRSGRDETSALDLNIATWHWLADQDPAAANILQSMPRESETFFELQFFSALKNTWGGLQDRVQSLKRDAGVYLEKDSISGDLEALLDFLYVKTLLNDPELIGISLMFLDQLPFALALAKYIKQVEQGSGRRAIVLGGAAVSATYPEEILAACPFLDYIIAGEGEGPLSALVNREPLSGIPGLLYRDGDRIQAVRHRPAAFCDEAFPYPDFSNFDTSLYFNPQPVLPLVLSRGCGWNRCKFCAHNFSFAGYRVKEIDSIVDYISGIQAKTGISHFYFADQYIKPQTLEALSDALIWNHSSIHFHVMGRPTADYTPALLEKAAIAGCRWISWGVETGSQRLLDLVGKGTQREQVAQVLKDTASAGIANLMMMIFGLPTSTDADLDDTFSFIDDVYPYIAAMTASSFVLFDGTPFARHPSKYGLLPAGPQTVLQMPRGDIHSRRLSFKEGTVEADARLPRGPGEVALWEKRRPWLGPPPFMESLTCEHFLLYSSMTLEPSHSRPLSPMTRSA
jgi:hypothetical protein